MPETINDIRTKAVKKLKSSVAQRSALLINSQRSVFDKLQLTVYNGDTSSASMFNNIVDAVVDEINVQNTTLDMIEEQFMFWRENRMAQLQALGKRVSQLETDMNSALMAMDETDGFYYTTSESFDDNTNIDVALSGTLPVAGEVIAAPTSSALIDSSGLSVNARIYAANLPVTVTAGNTSKIFDNQLDEAWISTGNINASTDKCIAELTITGFDTETAINKIQVLVGNNTSTATYYLSGLYTEDGSQWGSLCDNKLITDSFTMTFPGIIPQTIKLFLRNVSPSKQNNGSFDYEFKVREIRMFREAYKSASSLYTLPTQIYDSDDNPVTFNTLSIQTDEELSDQDLDCYVSFGYGDIYSDFTAITPTNRDGSAVEITSSTITTDSLITLDNSKFFPYFYGSNRLIDLSIDSTFILGSIKLIRNIGEWNSLNAIKTCYIYLDSSTTLDFGDMNVLLNNVIVSGSNTLSAGVHTIGVDSAASASTVETILGNASVSFGQHLSYYTGVDAFIGADEDDYTVVALTDTKSAIDGDFNGQGLMVKMIEDTSDEELLVIYKTFNASNVADRFKLKFVFNSDGAQTPVLKKVLTKVNKV